MASELLVTTYPHLAMPYSSWSDYELNSRLDELIEKRIMARQNLKSLTLNIQEVKKVLQRRGYVIEI